MYATYADAFRPAPRVQGFLYDALLIVAGSLLIALSAQLSLHIPFSPVPITGQTFAILMLALLFGRQRATLTVLAYLGEGMTGFPVFAGGMAGIQTFFGPTGGYLLGFVAAAFVVGMLAEHGWDRRTVTTVLAMVLGNAVIYAFGVAWLAVMVGAKQALMVGVAPFLVGDALKIMLAAMLAPAGWKLLRQNPRG